MFRPSYNPAMATYVDRLSRSPADFPALTELTPDKLDGLLAESEPVHAAAEARRHDRPGRKRNAGAGSKFALPLGDRPLMLLVYYRAYVSRAFLGFLFAGDDATVCRNVAALQLLLAGIFKIPERRVGLGDDEARELFVDATERPTNRSGRGQAAFYSGEKKRHKFKHQVVVVRKRKPPGRPPWTGASGYQGVAGMRLPHKKPKGEELTPKQKVHNPRARPAAGLGRARDRQDEGVADRRRPVPGLAAAAHGGVQERGRAAQPDVRVTTQGEAYKHYPVLPCSNSVHSDLWRNPFPMTRRVQPTRRVKMPLSIWNGGRHL